MHKKTWLDELAYRMLEEREKLEIEEREDLKSKGQERCPQVQSHWRNRDRL